MFRYGVGSILLAMLLTAIPASASGPGDVPWTPRGLAGTPVLAVEPMLGDLYVGAADVCAGALPGALSSVGFVCVLTSGGRLLGGVMGPEGVAEWTDLSSALPETVITDFGVHGSFLAVGTQADGVFTKLCQSSSAADLPAAPRLALAAAPNPFNPATTTRFETATAARTRLCVYDLRSAVVANLLDADLPAGRHALHRSGRDDRGGAAPSGTQLIRLTCGGERRTAKVAFAK
jgi:hypothetical protein